MMEKYLPNVIQNSSEDGEVWVADNASTDGSLAFVHEKFPTVKTIALTVTMVLPKATTVRWQRSSPTTTCCLIPTLR